MGGIKKIGGGYLKTFTKLQHHLPSIQVFHKNKVKMMALINYKHQDAIISIYLIII